MESEDENINNYYQKRFVDGTKCLYLCTHFSSVGTHHCIEPAQLQTNPLILRLDTTTATVGSSESERKHQTHYDNLLSPFCRLLGQFCAVKHAPPSHSTFFIIEFLLPTQ